MQQHAKSIYHCIGGNTLRMARGFEPLEHFKKGGRLKTHIFQMCMYTHVPLSGCLTISFNQKKQILHYKYFTKLISTHVVKIVIGAL